MVNINYDLFYQKYFIQTNKMLLVILTLVNYIRTFENVFDAPSLQNCDLMGETILHFFFYTHNYLVVIIYVSIFFSF